MRTFAKAILIFVISLGLGFFLTHGGMDTWDSDFHLNQSRWLISRYLPFLPTAPVDESKWYGPLWETVLGFFSQVVFGFLHDPTWVMLAVTFTLLPLTLAATFYGLRRAGYSRGTALLALAMISSDIRLLGHSLINTKDFPLACFYLLTTIFLWIRLREARFQARWIFTCVAMSLVCYLTRPPMLFHFLVFLCWLVAAAALRGWKTLATSVAIAIGSAVVFIYALWPTLWAAGIEGWFDSFTRFSHYAPRTGFIHLLGQSFDIAKLPAWYPLFWFPVAIEPLGFAVFLVGLALGLYSIFTRKPALLSMPLLSWIALFVAAPLLANTIIAPTLYDEDRQLLFLFPVALTFAALALDRVPPRIKTALTIALLAANLGSWAQWGRFAYVYRSPAVLGLDSADFAGDYWGTCVDPALEKAMKAFPDNAPINLYAPYPIVSLEEARLLIRAKGIPLPRLRWHLHGAPVTGDFVFTYNRPGPGRSELAQLQADIESGKAVKIAEIKMPLDGAACLVGRY